MEKFNTRTTRFQQMRILCALALLVLVTACSSVRFTYNHGDTLLYWWINAYLDLDSDQKGWVKRDIDYLVNWHRKTQLRDYAQLLATAQRQLGGNLTHAELHADYREIKGRTELLLFKAMPELAELARSVRPDQVAKLEKKFASNNKDYRKKFLRGDRAKQQHVRYKKAMEQFELWFGRFSDEQEQAIRKLSDARPLDNEIWLEERIRRQARIVTLLNKVQREKLGRDATMALIHGAIRDSFDRLERSERKAFFDASTDGTIAMILGVVQMATPAQKGHAHKRMQGWIDDFNSLAADGK